MANHFRRKAGSFFSSRGKKVNNRERLYKMLFYYVKAGVVNIVQAAEVVYPLFGIKRRGDWLEDLRGKIPEAEYHFLKSSRDSGKLEDGLKNLYQHVEKMGKTKKEFLLSIFFPAIEVIFAVGIFIFIMMYVVPKFSELVTAFGGELPGISKAVFSAGKFLLDFFPLIIIFLLLSGWYLSRNWEYVLSLFPFMRRISLLYEKVLLFESLGFAYASGFNLHQAFSNIHLHLFDLSSVRDSIMNGESFHHALAPYLMPHEIAMLQAGEATGSLDEVLPWLAEMTRDELFSRLKKLSDAVVPIITIVLGSLVFLVLISIYLPLMGIATRL